MKTMKTFGSIATASLIITATMPALAQRTVEQCANALKARGYNITSMDIGDGRIYEYDGIKNNQKYDIKTDMSCKILLEKVEN